MPKFKCYVRQWVEEIAEIEVEAENDEWAYDRALSMNELHEQGCDVDIDWEDGSDSKDFEVYRVADKHGKVLWEKD